MIVAENISRVFQKKSGRAYEKGQQIKVMEEMTFHIPKGEVVGITGLNGAGKTTLLKMIAGVLAPTAGRIHVMGVDPVAKHKQIEKEIVLILPSSTLLCEDVRVKDSMELIRQMYQIPTADYECRMECLKKEFGLEKLMDSRKWELSTGELRRVDLALAFLIEPKLLLLDEALVGVDLIYRERALRYLSWMNQSKHTTILMTSHQISDLRKVCSRLLVIAEGRKLFYGSPDELERNYASRAVITIELKDQIPDLGDLAVEEYRITENKLIILYQRNLISAKTILHHILDQCELGEICIREQDLEQALLQLQEGSCV